MNEHSRYWCLFWAGGNLAIGIADNSVINLGFAACLIAMLIHDWWNRRGKRVARALGAKSRALLARLTIEPARA